MAWHFQFTKIIGDFTQKLSEITPQTSEFFIANCNRVNSETNFDDVALQMIKQLNSRTNFFEVAEYYQDGNTPQYSVILLRAAQPT